MIETNEYRSAGQGMSGANEQGVSRVYDEARTVPLQSTRRKLRLKEVVAALEEAGLDPIVELCAIVQAGDLDAGLKVKTLLSLAEFVHPKRKVQENTGPNGGPQEHVFRWQS